MSSFFCPFGVSYTTQDGTVLVDNLEANSQGIEIQEALKAMTPRSSFDAGAIYIEACNWEMSEDDLRTGFGKSVRRPQ